MDQSEDAEVTARLAQLWSNGDRRTFSIVYVSKVLPGLRRTLVRDLRLDESDADDCIGEALESFFARETSTGVANPRAYLAQSARNNGVTLHRRRQRELVKCISIMVAAELDPKDSSPTERPPVPEQWAVVAVEEAFEEVEADESWATVVIEAALEDLTLGQQRIIRHLWEITYDLSRKDFEVHSREAALALGMNAAAFRKAKQRAYEALRQAIPKAARRLGVMPPARIAAIFEQTRGQFMDGADEPD
jgi:DNA-directed RNA polymerase specialized sigma24 family protein